VIAATEFFTVEVLTVGGLVRYVVWFIIDLESRCVHIAGLIRHPHDAWIQQVARNLTDSVDGFLRSKRYLIHDRDPHYHLERNHQGLDNRLLTAVAAPANENAGPGAPVARRGRLAGILSYYYRPAA